MSETSSFSSKKTIDDYPSDDETEESTWVAISHMPEGSSHQWPQDFSVERYDANFHRNLNSSRNSGLHLGDINIWDVMAGFLSLATGQIRSGKFNCVFKFLILEIT